ncbi:hypothetical protein AYI68_g6602 [Smittium mucronatum]|uniref:SH3 domain-containing protein n=1 Tax=Smittium mucronatum TaxID=133383 RepID=A0A1R0GR12_9FUNG|nr:hypothetical protein AYI68_g6602 [Smittium mucronatum]
MKTFKLSGSAGSTMIALSSLLLASAQDLSFLLSAFGTSTSDLNTNSSSCFSLSDSKTCGQYFSSYYLPIISNSQSTISNSSVFDEFMTKYINSQSDIDDIQSTFGCSLNLDLWSKLPLRTAFVCRGLLSTPGSRACNKNVADSASQSTNTGVPPICRSDCLSYVESFSDLINQHGSCSNYTQLSGKISDLRLICSTNPFNGEQSNCMDLKQSSNQDCKYKSPQDSGACQYCLSNQSDPCCKSNKISDLCIQKKLSDSRAVSIASISIAGICFLLLILSMLLYLLNRRPKKSNDMNESTGFDGPQISRPTKNLSQNVLSDSFGSQNNSITFDNDQDTGPISNGCNPSDSSEKLVSNLTKSSKPNSTVKSSINQARLSNIRILKRKSNMRSSVPNLDAAERQVPMKSPLSNPTFTRSDLSGPVPVLGSRVQSAHNSPVFVDLRNKYLDSMAKSTDIKQAIINELEKFESDSSHESGADSPVYIENRSLENTAMTALYPYSPKEYDELSLKVGDEVQVIKVFSDGWALVEHKNSGRAGVIPIVCIYSNETSP